MCTYNVSENVYIATQAGVIDFVVCGLDEVSALWVVT